jgi:hypothetical protein
LAGAGEGEGKEGGCDAGFHDLWGISGLVGFLVGIQQGRPMVV